MCKIDEINIKYTAGSDAICVFLNHDPMISSCTPKQERKTKMKKHFSSFAAFCLAFLMVFGVLSLYSCNRSENPPDAQTEDSGKTEATAAPSAGELASGADNGAWIDEELLVKRLQSLPAVEKLKSSAKGDIIPVLIELSFGDRDIFAEADAYAENVISGKDVSSVEKAFDKTAGEKINASVSEKVGALLENDRAAAIREARDAYISEVNSSAFREFFAKKNISVKDEAYTDLLTPWMYNVELSAEQIVDILENDSDVYVEILGLTEEQKANAAETLKNWADVEFLVKRLRDPLAVEKIRHSAEDDAVHVSMDLDFGDRDVKAEAEAYAESIISGETPAAGEKAFDTATAEKISASVTEKIAGMLPDNKEDAKSTAKYAYLKEVNAAAFRELFENTGVTVSDDAALLISSLTDIELSAKQLVDILKSNPNVTVEILGLRDTQGHDF